MGRRLACLVVAAALLLAITAHASDLSTIVPTRVKIQVHKPTTLSFVPSAVESAASTLMLHLLSHLVY